MLRFLSRRKARNNYVETASASNANDRTDGRSPYAAGGSGATSSQIKPQRIPVNKNKIDCRVILLDNTDLPIELSVSFFGVPNKMSSVFETMAVNAIDTSVNIII